MRSALILAAALSCLPSASYCQRAIFGHLTIDDGLSQNIVRALVQDRRGYLWIGTDDGLNRYDGYRLITLERDPQDPGTLSSSQIRCLFEDRQGHLWIGTRNRGLNRYHPTTGNLERYEHDPQDPNSLPGSLVAVTYESRGGDLLVGTNRGLSRLDSDHSGRFTHLAAEELGSRVVRAIHEDEGGTLWLGTDAGLYRYDPETESLKGHSLFPEDSGGLKELVRSIEPGPDGDLWLATRGGLVSFDREIGEVSGRFFDGSDGAEADSIWDLHFESDGGLWISSYRGLVHFYPETLALKRYLHDPASPTSLGENKTRNLLADRSGVLWVGTSGAGLDKLVLEPKAFSTLSTTPYGEDVLSDAMVMSVIEDRAGVLWVGTWNGGLNRIDRNDGSVSHYLADPEDPCALTRPDVRAILEDREGRLWVGTEAGGLHLLDRTTGCFSHYRYDASDPTSLRDDDVWALHQGREGELWVGTYGGGLSRLAPDSEELSHFRHSPDDPHSLGSDIVRVLYEDSDGVLWVGTDNGGLNRFDHSSGRFTSYRHDSLDSTTLSSDDVLSILQDRSGRLWVGTHGGGLNQLLSDPAGARPSFRSYSRLDGLASDTVYGMLEDEEGRLWLSTNRGLSRFDPRSETFRTYDISDGLLSNEFNSGAYYRSAGGEMFFGGIHGLHAFRPREIHDNPYPPPVVLTGFKIFDKSVALDLDAANLSEITLQPGESIFSLEFAALSFASPEKNGYAYRLIGFREEWTDLGAKRDITFTNLDPGEYSFELKGSNHDGVWNESGPRLKVIVEPPFWRTWWFITSSLLLFVGALWGAYALRTRSMREHSLALQAEIDERRKLELDRVELIEALEINNEELESRNTEMERFTYTISHDLKAPLITIKGFLGLLETDVAEGDSERIRDDIQRITGAANSMGRLLTDLLELSRIGRIVNPDERVGLRELAEEALALLEAHISARPVEIDLAEHMPTVFCDRVRLIEVYQNLIENALKYRGDQESLRIEIGARREADRILAFVGDNGLGIDPAYRERVFDLFEQLDPACEGTGLGLALSRRIVEFHRGELWVESDGEGHGSTFFFSLPQDQEEQEALPERPDTPS